MERWPVGIIFETLKDVSDLDIEYMLASHVAALLEFTRVQACSDVVQLLTCQIYDTFADTVRLGREAFAWQD